MKFLKRLAAITALIAASSAASAWWGPWGGNNWGNNYNNGYGSGWGGLGGDQYRSGDASGGGDFSMNLSGRGNTNMRGYGSGYGAGDGWGRGYNYSSPFYGPGPYGYAAPMRGYPRPMNQPAMPLDAADGGPTHGYPAPASGDVLPGPSTATGSGEIVTDAAGMTLYTYAQDSTDVSNCYGQCASNWPPALFTGMEVPTEGMTVVERRDGTRQLALEGMPLYLWRGDQKPGDTTGDGFGGVWRVARR
jgi:predicted lipoprotein with Yx(FWY)xxD motif